MSHCARVREGRSERASSPRPPPSRRCRQVPSAAGCPPPSAQAGPSRAGSGPGHAAHRVLCAEGPLRGDLFPPGRRRLRAAQLPRTVRARVRHPRRREPGTPGCGSERGASGRCGRGEGAGGAAGAESCSRPWMHPLQLEGHVRRRAALPSLWPSGALGPHPGSPAFPTRNTSLDHWENDAGMGFAYIWTAPICAVYYLGEYRFAVESEGEKFETRSAIDVSGNACVSG